jgi:hypothetical protein
VTRRIETCDVSDGSSAVPRGLGTTTKAMSSYQEGGLLGCQLALRVAALL